MTAPTFLVGEERLRAWLEAQLGAPCDLGNRRLVPSFQQYAERFQLRCGAFDGQVLLRIYAAPFCLWPPFMVDVSCAVARALPRALEQGISHSRRLAYADFLPGQKAILSTWIDGDWTDWLRTPASCEGIAEHVAQLHASPSPAGLARMPLQTLLSELEALSVELDASEAQAILRELLGGGYGVEDAVWVHGDVHPGNFIQDSAGRRSLIDWDETIVADFRVDVANVWGLLRNYKGAEVAARFLVDYAQASGRQVTHIEAWWRLLSLRDWLAIEWLGRQVSPSPLAWVDKGNWLDYQSAAAEELGMGSAE